MGKGFTALAGIAMIGGLGFGVGVAMWQSGSAIGASQSGQAAAASAGAGTAAGANQLGQAAAARGQGAGSMAGAGTAGSGARGSVVAGTVASVSGDSVAVRTSNGTVTVALAATTAIRKTANITAAEIAAGESVLVMGQRGEDGAVAARTVQVGVSNTAETAGPAQGGFARQAGATPADTAQRSQGSLSPVAGTVESAAPDKLVVRTTAGSVTITLSAQTSLRKTTDGARSDLAPGANITVAGQQDADGAITASSIQIMPEGGR